MHQMLKDELDLDGKPNLNLARFVLLELRLQGRLNESGVVVSWAHTWSERLMRS